MASTPEPTNESIAEDATTIILRASPPEERMIFFRSFEPDMSRRIAISTAARSPAAILDSIFRTLQASTCIAPLDLCFCKNCPPHFKTKDSRNAARKRGRAIAAWILDGLCGRDPLLLDDSYKFYRDEETALTLAGWRSDSFVWEMIKRGANVNQTCASGYSTLWTYAKFGNDPEVMRLLLSKSSDKIMQMRTPVRVQSHSALRALVYRICVCVDDFEPFLQEMLTTMLEFAHGDGSGIQLEDDEDTDNDQESHGFLHITFKSFTSLAPAAYTNQSANNYGVLCAHFKVARLRISRWQQEFPIVFYDCVGVSFQIPVLFALIKEYLIVG
jgi:hypothetical protein